VTVARILHGKRQKTTDRLVKHTHTSLTQALQDYATI